MRRLPSWSWWRLVLAAAALVLLLPPPAALANAAPYRLGGARLGEPLADLRDIAVAQEDLTLDLRPLEHAQPAIVEASYHLDNRGPARHLDVLFVIGSKMREGAAVWLDDAAVPVASTGPAALPPDWQPPRTTPAIAGERPLEYKVDEGSTVPFSIDLPSGRHTLRVRYAAEASAYSGTEPTRYWQLGYVLAPARAWSAFGVLNVTVHLPAGWAAASSPALERQGDSLQGRFDGIPADALALTVQAPPPVILDPLWFAWPGGLIVVAALGALAGRWLGRRGRSSWWALLIAPLLGGLWMAIVMVAALVDPSPVPPEQVAWTYQYGRGILGLLGSLLAVPAGVIVAQLAAAIARRRTKAQAPARPAGS